MLYPAELRARGEKQHILPYSAPQPMTRPPLTWQAQVRCELIEQELAKLREVPHSLWRDVVGQPMRKTARARDNRDYRIRTTVEWAAPGSHNIRVTVALETASLGRRLQSQSFVLTPENRFTE
jgi:hypothetical protein